MYISQAAEYIPENGLQLQHSSGCTEITEVNLSAFVYRLFHEDPTSEEKSS